MQGGEHSVRLTTLVNASTTSTGTSTTTGTASSATNPMKTRGGFTLIEILLAALATSLILGAVYGIFHQAVRIRDQRDTTHAGIRACGCGRKKSSAATCDNALVSGGLLASVLQGDSASRRQWVSQHRPALPTPTPATSPATCGSRRPPAATTPITGLSGDVQQVEYYLARDPNAADQNGTGVLMRAVTRDLLDASGLTSSSSSSSSANAATSTNAPTETAVFAGRAVVPGVVLRRRELADELAIRGPGREDQPRRRAWRRRARARARPPARRSSPDKRACRMRSALIFSKRPPPRTAPCPRRWRFSCPGPRNPSSPRRPPTPAVRRSNES